MWRLRDGDELIKPDEWTSVVPELVVTDVTRSSDVYTRLFGFEVQRTQPDVVMLRRSTGEQVILHQYGAANPLVVAELEVPFGRGVTLTLRADDVNAIYSRLRAEKYEVLVPIQISELEQDGQQFTRTWFVVQDPDGYQLRFTD